MSYVSASTYDLDYAAAPAAESPLADYLPRSVYLPIPFLVPLLICGFSWLAGGVPILTDIGFVLLTFLCIILLINELVRFPRRFGTGGLLFFGGFLVWFCQDYLTNWLGRDFRSGFVPFTAETVAKAAFYHCLLAISMVIGLLFPWGRRVERLLLSLPEPASPNLYFWTTIGLCLVGLSAFAFFTSENFFTSLYHAMFAQWVGGVHWTAGRTGNYNYSWGGYVTQLLEIGVLSGLFGLFYATLVGRNVVLRTIAMLVWVFWTLYTFQDGRRGEMAKMVLPAVALLFIKYQATAVENFREHSLRAYLVAGAIGLVLLAAIQFEGAFRTQGYTAGDVGKVELLAARGNTMFSEGLNGFDLVPDKVLFFSNRIPGEGALRAMPETLFYFLLHPIPRALWNSKPSDPAMIWYNQVVAGTNGLEGTTISQGLAGHWYIRYGLMGVIEGGLLIGWLMRMVERVLQDAQGRPTTILFSLSLSVWLFRTYRNFYFLDLWPMLLAFILFGLLVKISRLFGSAA
jgi:hypothetical protein